MKMHPCNTMKLLCAWALLGCAFASHAASFDCGKAKSNVEKMVCSDVETSSLDDKLQQAYKTALAATDAYGRRALAKEQRNWIKYARGICQDATCLRQVYADRIAVLARNDKHIVNDQSCVKPSGYQGDASDCGVSIEVYRDPNDHIESFNQSLAIDKQRGRIVGCRRLIVQRSGTRIGPGPGNQNFGGYCVLQNGMQLRDVMICDDTMVGNFSMQSVDPRNRTDKHLIDFTYDRCYEGG